MRNWGYADAPHPHTPNFAFKMVESLQNTKIMALLLFVDDDPFTLETLAKAAQVLGHQAIVASSGQEALKAIAEQSPDLIFTDMRLPDTDGVTLIVQLQSQENTARIPMFVLSASPAEDAVERSQAAGARAYLNKPIRLQTLLDIIREFTSE
jgi:CheY-like chemotaxis protein